jgi:O-methyltransferase
MSASYLSVLKKSLTAPLYPESAWRILRPERFGPLKSAILRQFYKRGLAVVLREPYGPEVRAHGEDWPLFGYSMVGTKRLDNIETCLKSVVAEKIPGDFVECGVWRGGASIFARAVLNTLDETQRIVWLADSFEGMPVQSERDKADPALAGNAYLAVSLEDVKSNFERFDLLGDNVRFIKGWFCDALPTAPIEKISILRLDGDYYSSTMDALRNLYDKVSPGGYVIVDDYNACKSCEEAIAEFSAERGIVPHLVQIDRTAVYWRKPFVA